MAAASLTEGSSGRRLEVAAGGLLSALIAVVPVSTSAAEILYWVWLAVAVAASGFDRLARAVRHPAAWTALIVVALAAAGLIWTIAPAKEALKQFSVLFQFIVLPVLFAQMRWQRDARGPAIAILAAAAFVWTLSVATWFWPNLMVLSSQQPGIPFKNYATQSFLFTLVAFGLLHWGVHTFRHQRYAMAWMSFVGALLLIANVVFLTSSRTTLIALIPLLALLTAQLSGWGWRRLLAGAAVAVVAAAVIWLTSAHVRDRIVSIPQEIDRAATQGDMTSSGLRMVYWKKALGFIAERPVFGHGTGAAPELYRRAASGTGLTADTPGDPHNQVLAFAIPFGLVGVLALAAALIAHLCLVWGSGLERFIGQGVLLLFLMSGAVNSHLMTFTESKMYLFSIGILGGLVLSRIRQPHDTARDKSAA